MSQPIDPMMRIKALEHDVQLLSLALAKMDPEEPNMGQLKFIQLRVQQDQGEIVQLLNHSQVSKDVKDRLGRAYGFLSSTDEAIDDVEDGKLDEFGVIIEKLHAADTHLKFKL